MENQAKTAQDTPLNAVKAKRESTAFIALSVLELVCCGGIFALVPLVLSIQYKAALGAGDHDRALAKRKSARMALLVVLAVGIAAFVVYVALLNKHMYRIV